jgi:tetratricopeptide (TPR) repeat protein
MKRKAPISILLLCLSLLYPLQRWIDKNYPREVISEDTLYFTSGETIRKMSLSFTGLVADVYWIRTIQYFGEKLMYAPQDVTDIRQIRMDLLAPYLDIVVTLDPQMVPAYRFGAIFLPDRDVQAAINLLERGIRENPNEWRLYQDIAYIYWQTGDYEKAADWFDRGGRIEGARWWMRDMAGVMRIKGGSRETARAVYEKYLDSEDQNIRNQAEERLIQLRALEEIDLINILLERSKDQPASCEARLRSLAPRLRQYGIAIDDTRMPLDPRGFAYHLDTVNCQVKLSDQSKVYR